MPETENKIQKITRLLEKGGTMLATHHECGAPMFRYQGKTLCPVCDFQEKQEIKPSKEARGVQGYKEEEPSGMEARTPPAGGYQTISKVIMNKILDIAAGLEAETDLQRVKYKMECIEQGLKILELLQD